MYLNVVAAYRSVLFSHSDFEFLHPLQPSGNLYLIGSLARKIQKCRVLILGSYMQWDPLQSIPDKLMCEDKFHNAKL